jgi:hypothetical protein
MKSWCFPIDGGRQEKADIGRIFSADDRFLPMLENRNPARQCRELAPGVRPDVVSSGRHLRAGSLQIS